MIGSKRSSVSTFEKGSRLKLAHLWLGYRNRHFIRGAIAVKPNPIQDTANGIDRR
jgi:hypothetical protein